MILQKSIIIGDSNSMFIKLGGLENLAQAGFRAAQVLERVKNVDAGETVIIGVGINDSATITNIVSGGKIDPKIDQFEQTYSEILTLFKAKFKRVVSLGLVSSTEEEVRLDDTEIYYDNSEIIKFNKKIKELCKKFEVEFIDLLPYFLGREEELLSDHIHPNKKGQVIIQKELESRLAQL